MRRILFIVLTLLSTLLPGLAHAWWQAEWAYRKPITIDGGPQAGGDSRGLPGLQGECVHRSAP